MGLGYIWIGIDTELGWIWNWEIWIYVCSLGFYGVEILI